MSRHGITWLGIFFVGNVIVNSLARAVVTPLCVRADSDLPFFAYMAVLVAWPVACVMLCRKTRKDEPAKVAAD